MLWWYKLATQVSYGLVYPVARLMAGRGNRKWRDRLGLGDDAQRSDIWLHAASVGEVKVLSYLIHYLSRKKPGLRYFVTVMTSSGFRAASDMFNNDVSVGYLPWDYRSTVARVLDRVSPRVLVVAETEIWPNLIMQAHERGVAIVLVNGRMSAKGFSRYGKMAGAMQKLLQHYDHFFFKSAEDAARYLYFGIGDDVGQVTGDMKFDAPLLPRSEGRRAEIRYRAGIAEDAFVLVAGSTRPGEEPMLLNAWGKVNMSPDRGSHLILAPRHVERAGEIRELCEARNMPCSLYGAAGAANEVVLVDRMGILVELYMAAELAFVGGTLVDIGGHNVLEPVWAGTPVLFGPSTGNVREAAEYIKQHRFGAQVESAEEMITVIQGCLDGAVTFARKTENDLSESPTARAGEYILDTLAHV